MTKFFFPLLLIVLGCSSSNEDIENSSNKKYQNLIKSDSLYFSYKFQFGADTDSIVKLSILKSEPVKVRNDQLIIELMSICIDDESVKNTGSIELKDEGVVFIDSDTIYVSSLEHYHDFYYFFINQDEMFLGIKSRGRLPVSLWNLDTNLSDSLVYDAFKNQQK